VAEQKPAEEKPAANHQNTPQRVDVDSYTIAIQRIGNHSILSQDGRKYIVAREGDSLESLADLLGISERSIRRYNELDKNYTVSVGDKLFIEK
jgi:LysM repeat protein